MDEVEEYDAPVSLIGWFQVSIPKNFLPTFDPTNIKINPIRNILDFSGFILKRVIIEYKSVNTPNQNIRVNLSIYYNIRKIF